MKSSYSFMMRLINRTEHETYVEHRMSCVEHELPLGLYERLKFIQTFNSEFEWLEFRYYTVHIGIRRVRKYKSVFI